MNTYEDGHKGLHSADCEFYFGIFGDTFDAEVEPAFGVDSIFAFDSVVHAVESVLYGRGVTLNSDSCRTSWMLPDSKLELIVMYL